MIEQVQAREASGVHLVDELPQGVETLVADVAADPLDGLDLVQNQQQARVPRVPQDDQHALEEAQGAEMVDVALHAGRAFRCRRHVRLARQPSQDALGRRLVAPAPGPRGSLAGPR